MIFEFGEYAIDINAQELRCKGETVAVEPQVFSLLCLLVENRDRMISKDEIIEKVWGGRIVSESAVTSRVKSARQALGDDGKAQKYIKTVHGRGFRFVGEVGVRGVALRVAPAPEPESAPLAEARGKPSIAVLPFRLVGVAGPFSAIGDALPYELITALSRLRWLFVIARASSFRFRGGDIDIAEVGRTLGARYCLSGMIEIAGSKIAVTVELADALGGGVIWGERYAGSVDDVYEIRAEIVHSIIAALEIQIPQHEAQRARLAAPGSLDAWSVYHIGLQHLYRFNSRDNAEASARFREAIALDKDFARAHAALSAAQFQDAFLHYTDDTAAAQHAARLHAERAVEIDALDPFANFALGRVHWIEGNVSGGDSWLDRSIALSPNYAQGKYARAWADAVAGDGRIGRESVDHAMALSPLDPFRYAMLGVRAFTHILAGEDVEAARWAVDAAKTPGAHALIAMIAAAACANIGDMAEAEKWAARAKDMYPAVSRREFFRAFPFENEAARDKFDRALQKLGF